MEELIGRWVSGDPAAAERLYRTYFARVREFVLKVVDTITVNEAEEIAHEAIVSGLRGIRAGNRPDRMTYWLLGIAKRMATRKEKVEVALSHVVDPDQRSGKTLAVRREMDALLRRVLDDLPPALREVMNLMHRVGVTRKEAAERLGVPLDTVHARCERAYARLREELTRHFTTLAIRHWTPKVVELADIRGLRPNFRDAVMARHLEEWSEKLCAARLGVPVPTFRARLESGYELLKCDSTADFGKAREEYKRAKNKGD